MSLYKEEAELPVIKDESLGRRDALRKMGLFAAYSTPIVIGVMTSRKTMAASGGTDGGGNNGFGNGGNDGVPGNSGFPDTNR
jgi:hypothetical protein